jgi:small subunit ribosomal protein S6
MTRPYEIVYIFDSSLEEDQVKTHLESFHELLKSPEKPEPVTNSNHWGKRTLAYPIKGRDVGYYVVEEFETLQENLGEFERLIKLNENVLRYLVVLNEGEQPRVVSTEGGFDRRGGGDDFDRDGGKKASDGEGDKKVAIGEGDEKVAASVSDETAGDGEEDSNGAS